MHIFTDPLSISKHCLSICDISSHSSRTSICCYCCEKRMLHAKSSDHESLIIWYLTNLKLRIFWANFFCPMGPNFKLLDSNTQYGTPPDTWRVSSDSIWHPSSCIPCLFGCPFRRISISFVEVWYQQNPCPIQVIHFLIQHFFETMIKRGLCVFFSQRGN